jgi:hypothetical protein
MYVKSTSISEWSSDASAALHKFHPSRSSAMNAAGTAARGLNVIHSSSSRRLFGRDRAPLCLMQGAHARIGQFRRLKSCPTVCTHSGMPFTLRLSLPDRPHGPEDWLVLDDGVVVGNIEEDLAAWRPETRWSWALGGAADRAFQHGIRGSGTRRR